MTTRSARARLVVAVVVLGTASPGMPSASGAPCPVGGRYTTQPDAWTEAPAPDFEDEPTEQDVLASAILPGNFQVMYATNGVSVYRTTDGGCTWLQVYRATEAPILPQVGGVDLADRVLDVAVPDAGSNWSSVYLLVEQSAAGVSRPGVLASTDRGATWVLGTGLPLTGEARALAIAPGGERAYVSVTDRLLSGATGTGDSAVYVTEDSGATWIRATPTTESRAFSGLLPDVLDPERVFAWNADGLYASQDGARSFSKVRQVAKNVRDVTATVGPNGTMLAVAYTNSTRVDLSEDGGRSWFSLASPDVVDSLAATSMLNLLALSGGGSVSLVFLGKGLRDVTPTTSYLPTDLMFGWNGRAPVLVGRTPRSFMSYEIALDRPKTERLLPVDLGDPVDVVVGKPRLTPARTTVALRPGESKRLTYNLALPPVPTPLDVYFLVDTTGSMGGTINGLRSGIGTIVRELAESGIDAQFGLANFRDYPITPYGGIGDYAYQRNREIGLADEELRNAIASLRTGDGGDGPESTLPALYQSVTGEGDVLGRVPPGHAALFRDGSMRVIVVATDVRFHTEPSYPGPSFEKTLTALNRERAHVVGLAVNGQGRHDLERAALGTETRAPESVDCDGDRKGDLAAGEALVCDVHDAPDVLIGIGDAAPRVPIADAIVSLLRSVRDVVPVQMTTDRPEVSRVLGSGNGRRVDVKRANSLSYTVEVNCPLGTGGHTYPITLRAARPGRPLGSAAIELRCGALPVPPPDKPNPPAPAPPRLVTPLAAVVVPAPPPIDVLPNPQPNMQPHPNPQTQPQVHAGLAAQTDTQGEPALAVADQQVRDEELALVGLGADDVAAQYVLCAGMVLAAAAGTAMARRRRTSVVPVPVRVRSGGPHNGRRARRL